MFKKSNKLNIRKRRDTEEDNVDTEDSNVYDATPKLPQNITNNIKVKKDKPKKSKDTKKASLLSFDDAEEEESVLTLKKSSRSKRIVKQIKKRSQEEKEAKVTPTPVNTKSTGTSKIKNNNAEIKQSTEKEFHIFQSQAKNKNGSGNHVVDSAGMPPLDSQFAGFNSGSIPTPSMIHAARKQREMLRKFGSEIISQEDTQKYKDKNQSRLVRDDDDDYGSSDDGVMEMKGIQQKKSNTSKKYVPNESEEEVDSADEAANADEEVNRWEEEIIKKGINSQTNQGTLPVKPSTINAQQMTSYNAYTNAFYGNQLQNDSQQAYRHVEAKADVDFLTIRKRLEAHSDSIKESNKNHHAEMDRLLYDAGESEHLSNHLGDVKSISQEYQFYQEFRDYIKDLVGCLREHVSLINGLEQNVHMLWKNQSDRLISRRRQDIQDESCQTAPASKTTQDKNSDSQYVQRVREREARRTRRRASRQIKQSSSTHYDGFSTDDEETSMDMAQFNTDFKRIQDSSDSMFDDAVEDFCDVRLILQRFSDWRKSQKDSYNDAYIALCIPKLVIPFIKLKTMLWNPLLSSTQHYEEEEWFKLLSTFGLKNFSTDCEDSSSNVLDDTKVISSVIEKVLVVKLNRFIDDIWDPLSMQQTIRLTLLLKQLVRDYPFMTAENSQCQRLFQSVCKRLQCAIDNDIFIPLLPLSSADSPAHMFLERQTWACIKLFKNTMLFDGLLSYKVLCEMAFDSLLNRYILLALQMSVMNVTCLYKCQKITDSIPKSWLITYDDFSSHLSSLTRFLVHFAKTIQGSDQYASKTMIKQIKTMLLVMGSREALVKI